MGVQIRDDGFCTITGTIKKKCGIIRKDAVPLPRAILIIWRFTKGFNNSLLELFITRKFIILINYFLFKGRHSRNHTRFSAFKLTSFSVLCITTFVILINEF